MKPFTMINRLVVKPGKMDEFIEMQRRFAAAGPVGLIGGRMYRSPDGQSAILVSMFQSKAAQEEIFQRPEFKAHIASLQPLVESSNPMAYEEAYTTGNFA